MINKSFVTNFLSGCLVLVGLFVPFAEEYQLCKEVIFTVGLFAFSGGITNWIAVYMLFEKVPGLYGSGVIPSRFQEFKEGIKNLMMNQFFTKENVDKFLNGSGIERIDLMPIIEDTDFNPMFDALVKSILESSFGGMIAMVGGSAVLETLREPVVVRLKDATVNMVSSEEFHRRIAEKLVKKDDDILEKISTIVQKRLDELTPDLVKKIIQDMIRKHLGWLVVWGGVFGGLIGFTTVFLR